MHWLRVIVRAAAFLGTMWCWKSAFAGGLIEKLPPDGAWAKYSLEWKRATPEGEIKQLRVGELFVSSVGVEEVAGDRCRWIEIRHFVEADGAKRASVLKMLIPEKNLIAGLNPLGNVVRAWNRHAIDVVPQEIKELKGEQARPIRALTDMFFGSPAEVSTLNDETIENEKLGKVVCPGIAAHYVLKRGHLESIFDYEVRVHDKAPFGVVTFSSASIHKEAGVVRIPSNQTILKLIDSGTDAKSELPDHQ